MINRDKIRRIQDKIQAAISQIEKEEEVSISFGTRTFSDTQYTTKMTVVTKSTDTRTIKAIEDNNTILSKSLGFNGNIIGKKVVINGMELTISSFKMKNRKYPIIADCKNGKSYKLSETQIKGLIK